MKKFNVGVIGCGNISGIYIENINSFDNVRVHAVCDIVPERAAEVCATYGIENNFTYDEIISCPDIQIILNLTLPKGHYTISRDALLAGKHVYLEKPISLSIEDGKALLALAEEKNLFIGCAPDTFLGAGLQTCIKAIDEGLIGRVIGATAFMLCHGHESWHLDPEFYYEKGGGPMFDMGPYYVTALVAMIGPVTEVTGMNSASFAQRTITSEKKRGKVVDVEVPTHVTGLMRFKNGAVGNIITSFDVWGSTLPFIEVYGTKGTLKVPDPNWFDGQALVRLEGSDSFEPLPLRGRYSKNSRGLGVSDMAACILDGRTGGHRASGELACHVMDIMQSIYRSQDSRAYVTLSTTCKKPEAMLE